MDDKVIFKLGSSFLVNAGILGLLNCLKENDAVENTDYIIDGQNLYVDSGYLKNNDIPQMYVKATSNILYNKAKIRVIIDSLSVIDAVIKNEKLNDKAKKEKLKKLYDNASALFAKKSFENGVSFINAKYNEDIVSLKLCKDFKACKDNEEKNRMLKEVCEQIKRPEAFSELVFRDLISFQFKSFFVTNSLTNVMSAFNDIKTKSIAEFYNNKYFEPLIKSLDEKKKATIRCIECRETTSSKTEMSFMIDTTDDLGRKKSAYWNCIPDAYICEKCAFLYTFVPLGFAYLGQDAVFINNNFDIKNLQGNMQYFRDRPDEEESNKDKMFYRAFIGLKTKALENKLSNIQVISRNMSSNHFKMNVIGKDMVIKLSDSSEYLERIEKVYLKDGENYINIFDEVFYNILSGRNQYGLIHKLLLISMKTNKNVNYLYDILKINIIFRGGENVNELMKKVKTAYMCGKEMRYKITGRMEEADIDNSLRGYVYKLNNAISVGNRDMFLDAIIRTYSGNGLPIPSVFMDCFESDESFKSIGQSYILGLKYQKFEKKNETNEEDMKNVK